MHRLFQVVELEGDLRVLARGRPADSKCEPARTALVPKSTRPLLDELEAELLRLEPASPVEILAGSRIAAGRRITRKHV
jgi:hypothetical protein